MPNLAFVKCPHCRNGALFEISKYIVQCHKCGGPFVIRIIEGVIDVKATT